MKKILSLIAVIALTSLPVLAQTSPNVRFNSLNAMVQYTPLSTNVSAMVTGDTAAGESYAGDFFYDSASSAATNTYSVFKPASTTGRWIRRNEGAWNQFTAATAANEGTYAFRMHRNLATNVFGFGADNNNVYLQSWGGYALHLNNQGNSTVLNSTAGSVGIGADSPASLLEVRGGLTTSGSIITLGTKEPSVVLNDVLGRINFYAPLDAAGTDANLVAGSIATVSEGTFSATSNASSLIFQTGASETATTKMTITSAGNVGVGVTSPVSLTEIQGGLTTTGSILTLGTKEPSVVANDVLGRINFYAPLDAAGTDANLVAGSIATVAEGTFSATSNASSLVFQTGSSEVATTKVTISSGGNVTVANGNLVLGTAGNGFQIKEGSNARMGTATLSGGTIAVSNTSAATGDRIFIQRVSGTSAEFGHLSYTISNGVSFTINSTDAQDDSVVNWLIIKPTP